MGEGSRRSRSAWTGVPRAFVALVWRMRALIAAVFVISSCVVLADNSTVHAPGTASMGAEVQTYCVACTAVVQALGASGCKTACSVLPDPASQICTWMVNYLSMCADIENWLKQGLSDEDICTHLGYCGSGCQCGVCTEAVADQRAVHRPERLANASALPSALGSPVMAQCAMASRKHASMDNVAEMVGCCLTCF